MQSKCFDLVGSIINHRAKSYLKIPELELMKKVEVIEKSSNFLRKLKDNADPAINIKIGKQISRLDSNLMINQWSVAHRSTKHLFREVEMAYVLIKRNGPLVKELKNVDLSLGRPELIKAMKKSKVSPSYQTVLLESFDKHNSLKKFATALEIDTHSQLIRFGNKYHEYSLIRHHLDEILEDANCSNDICQRNVKTLLDRIGISSEKERTMFARIIGNYKRPSMKEVSQLLNENPIALLARIKKERNYELFSVVRDFILQPEIIERLFRGIYNLPGINQAKAIRVLRLVYDAQARNLHFPKINRIVRSTLPISDKLPLFKEINSTVDYDEIMVTFARRVDDATADTWKALKEAASGDEAFLARMAKAEKKALARGEISLTYEKSVVSKLATIIASGGSIGYFYFLGDEAEVIEVEGELIEDEQMNSNTNVTNIQNDNQIDTSIQSDENDIIIFSSDEDIEIEGEIEGAIEQLNNEVRDISEGSGNPLRGPSSIKSSQSWFLKFIYSLFSF